MNFVWGLFTSWGRGSDSTPSRELLNEDLEEGQSGSNSTKSIFMKLIQSKNLIFGQKSGEKDDNPLSNSGDWSLESDPAILSVNSDNNNKRQYNIEEQYQLMRNIQDSEKPDQISKDQKLKKDLLENEYDKQQKDKDFMLPGQPCYVPPKYLPKIGGWSVPKEVYVLIQQNVSNKADEQPYTKKSYTWRLHRLLWMEECKQELEMRQYDIKSLLLGRHENFLIIPVDGLSEGRPSLMRGDRLQLRQSNDSNGSKDDMSSSTNKYGDMFDDVSVADSHNPQITYEAFIHEVREDDVLVKPHLKCHLKDFAAVRYDVAFYTSRTTYRRAHHALECCSYSQNKSKTLALSNDININRKPLIDITNIQQRNLHNLDLNKQQIDAVLNIMRATCRPAPYIVYGPPGTGKSCTLVEAILQIHCTYKPDAKILVCCNSNSGTDLLTSRLLDSGAVDENTLLRLSAFHRMDKGVPPHLRHVTKDTDTLGNDYVGKYPIIVTTCYQAGCLYDYINARDGYYDFVFLDEAGRSTEPESLIPLSLMKPDGLLVLAGDPHQLGPVCISKIAAKCGLGESLLERLCRTCMLYQRIDKDIKSEEQSSKKQNHASPAQIQSSKTFCQSVAQTRDHEAQTHPNNSVNQAQSGRSGTRNQKESENVKNKKCAIASSGSRFRSRSRSRSRSRRRKSNHNDIGSTDSEHNENYVTQLQGQDQNCNWKGHSSRAHVKRLNSISENEQAALNRTNNRDSVVGDDHENELTIVSDNAKAEADEQLKTIAQVAKSYASCNGTRDPRYIMKLVHNYRSDERVMSINNGLFYNNELKFSLKTPQQCLQLLNVEYPAIFHAVYGQDRREKSNPSWFNPSEALVVIKYMTSLCCKGGGFKSDQVTVLTPYRSQRDKIRQLINATISSDSKISTIEEAQGEENEVVIISTVRCPNEKNISHDQKFHLGFLFSPKRFNTAISRAKWLVIVIGNPDVLQKDPCWSKYIDMCKKQNTYFKETQFKKSSKDD